MVFRLPEAYLFPDPCLAEDDGLIAVGGDLAPERILAAYRTGIFPWYSKGQPILWWSPDPRLVLFPEKLKISESLHQTLKSKKFMVRYDSCFTRVMRFCATMPRKEQDGTWITPGIKKAYRQLHLDGYAHSVEAWSDGALVGGLYGIAIGKVFFGESMFHLMRDASKVCLVHLVEKLRMDSFQLIDCQITTSHLLSMGAEEISRENFLSLLHNAI